MRTIGSSVETVINDSTEVSGRCYQPFRAWSMVAILALMLLLSFVDRYSLTVLVGPIKHDLHLSDTQIGLLLGTAFGVFYTLVGLPSGYLIDRFNRRNLLVAGVTIWTLMTILSGFAQSAMTLFVGRMGVGLGEAVLTPAAYSLIKDAFPQHYRGRAYGVYLFGSSVGTGAALLVVGWLSELLATRVLVLPVHGMAIWQQILVIIGIAGIPVAVLGTLISEPKRHGAGASATIEAVFQYLRANLRVYLPLILAYTVWGVCIYSYGAWLPTALSRAWGLPAPAVGSKYGLVTMAMAPVAVFLFSPIFDRLIKLDRARTVPAFTGLICMMIAVPTAIGPLAFTPRLTWICLGLNIFFAMGNQLALALVLAQVTPGRMLGKLSSFCFLCMNLVGLGLGPIMIPLVANYFGPSSSSLGRALSVVAGTGWVVVGILLLIVWSGGATAFSQSGTEDSRS